MKNKRSLFKLFVCVSALFLIWIVSAPLLAEYLIVEKPLEHCDTIWILSGSAVYIERNQEAAALYKKGVAAKIILTDDGVKAGWDKVENRNPSFAERARKELIARGVPLEAIEILPTVVNGTDEEAELFVNYSKQANFTSVLLVTSAYHSRRTFWTFERAAKKNGLSIDLGIESPPTGLQTPPPFYWWLTVSGWNFVGAEYVKFVYYKIVY